MTEPIYPLGIRTFKPSEKAPDFVLGTIIIDIDELNEWVNNEGEQYLKEYKGKMQLRLNVKTRKDDKGINLTVDTYTKE